MQKTIEITTDSHNGLYDITEKVKKIVSDSNVKTGVVHIYVQGATAAIMIQENWDESVQHDMLNLLKTLIPPGVWQHDHQDNNGDAHLKSGLIGPSESIPIINYNLGLSTWQNVFLCEFDGPRDDRKIIVTIFPC
ncbi:MAG: YjbQ family protein [Bacteroidales bacterium]|nr:YjbQ family protein [Bacteroidales bacterium]